MRTDVFSKNFDVLSSFVIRLKMFTLFVLIWKSSLLHGGVKLLVRMVQSDGELFLVIIGNHANLCALHENLFRLLIDTGYQNSVNQHLKAQM